MAKQSDVKRWIDKWLTKPIFSDDERESRRKYIFLNTVFLFAGIVATFMSLVRLFIVPILSLIDIVFALACFGLLLLLRRNINKIEIYSTIAIILAFILFYAIYLLAPYNKTRIALFFLLSASIFFLKGSRKGFIGTLILIATIVIGSFNPFLKVELSSFDILTVSVYLIALCFIFLNYEKGREEQNDYLYTANQNLEAKINARTIELTRLNKELEILNVALESEKLTLQQKNKTIEEGLDTLKLIEHEENLLNKLSRSLQICITSDEAYPRIEIIANELFPELSGNLSVLNTTTNKLLSVAEWGDIKIMKQEFYKGDCVGLRAGELSVVLDPKKTIPCQHYIHDPCDGYVIVPLNVLNEIIGVLHLFTKSKGHLTERVIALALSFSNIVKIALANIKLRDSLREQSFHDSLTTLYNRRYLNEYLAHELLRISREGGHVVVAMIDIDDFKKFNDQYGHKAGDIVLQFIGKSLNNFFRGTDVAFRFGGEEFTLVLSSGDLDIIIKRLNEYRELVSEKKIYSENELLSPITISIGVAIAPEQGRTFGDMIKKADQALYTAKKTGKNKLVKLETTT